MVVTLLLKLDINLTGKPEKEAEVTPPFLTIHSERHGGLERKSAARLQEKITGAQRSGRTVERM